jgi:uncharacterized protein with NRDE domain
MPVLTKVKKKSKKAPVTRILTELAIQKFIKKNFSLLSDSQLITSESLRETSEKVANKYLLNCVKVRKGICIFCNSKEVKVIDAPNTKFKFKCMNCRKVY